jgi:hypothetical protein
MVFVALSMAILSSIEISRMMVVKSETIVFSKVWERAILSEYDINLLNDYNILAYQGNDDDVGKKLNRYIDYSMKGKLDARVKGAEAELFGLELSDPGNFKKALRNSFLSNAAGSLKNGGMRIKRVHNDEEEKEYRYITNNVVLDTLPSKGTGNSFDTDGAASALQEGKLPESIREKGSSAAVEMLFIDKYLNNYMTYADGKESYLQNEWEYIITGKPDDKKSLDSCKRRIFLIRNALNLISIYKDPEKMEISLALAELITPGPLSAVTQAIIMESWAAAESKVDLDDLMNGKRVPAVKSHLTWRTDIGMLFESGDLAESIDQEARELIDKERAGRETSGGSDATEITEGQDYEDYLLVMMALMNENTRLLRTMDLVQINMKYRYYKDFNMDEYYCGVRFGISANGKNYESEAYYK